MENPIKTPLVNKIVLIIFGIFITSLIFAFSLHYLKETGLWVGTLFNIGIVAAILYYFKKSPSLRLIAWSILGTVIISTILFFAGLNFVSDILNKVV
ncbi:hypothetical protein HYW82_01345 [Candidatus Peregrinibacteria bacterium]|nr:hypothetical protein [Candidatus Peregrinibacteria bacterium]